MINGFDALQRTIEENKFSQIQDIAARFKGSRIGPVAILDNKGLTIERLIHSRTEYSYCLVTGMTLKGVKGEDFLANGLLEGDISVFEYNMYEGLLGGLIHEAYREKECKKPVVELHPYKINIHQYERIVKGDVRVFMSPSAFDD